MKKLNTISKIRENLINELDAYYKSKKTETNLDRLNSITKTSATIVRTAKVELEYAKFKGNDIEIPFLKQ